MESFEVICGVILSHLWSHFKSFVESFKVIGGIIESHLWSHFYKVFVAFWARKSLSEGLREASGGTPEAPEAPNWRQSGFLSDLWCHVVVLLPPVSGT